MTDRFMKRIFLNLFVAASLFTFCGCEDYLNVGSKSYLDDPAMFSDPETANDLLMNVYHAFGETNGYRSRMTTLFGCNTDIELRKDGYKNLSATAGDRYRLAVYTVTKNYNDRGFSDASSGKDCFSMQYAMIETCNLVIDGVRRHGDITKSSALGEILGEALTLRAFLYFDLIKYWGDVPARFSPADPKEIYMHKSDRSVIYDQIIADLGEAAQLVKWAGEGRYNSNVERVNKAFVKGLRARIALSAAGKALVRTDRDDHMAGDINPQTYSVGGNEGTIDYVFPNAEKRKEFYEIAKTEAMEVVAQNNHPLATNFQDIWVDVMNDVVTNGRESIFEIGFSPARGQIAHCFGNAHSGPDKYVMKKTASYLTAPATFWFDFDADDSRRNVTIVPYIYANQDDSKALEGGDPNGHQRPANLTEFSYGKYRPEYRTTRLENSGNDEGINFIVMRSADVYLMAAEAINELEGPNGENRAIDYLQAVRKRAFGGDGKMEDIDTSSKEAFLQAVKDERKYELGCELIRKQDLIRWGELSSSLKQLRRDVDNLRWQSDKYEEVPSYLWYKLAEDGETLITYGLEKGENKALADGITEANGWERFTLIDDADQTKSIPNNYLDGIYWDETCPAAELHAGNPDKRQLIPFDQNLLTSSMDYLVNDYGY